MLDKLLSLKFGFKGMIFSRFLLSRIGGLLFSRIERNGPSLVAFLKALTGMTIAVTVVRGGGKVNVIPSKCEVAVDFRLLSGQDEKYTLNFPRIALIFGEFQLNRSNAQKLQ